MLNSFREVLAYVKDYGLEADFKPRLEKIVDETDEQGWFNREGFEIELLKIS